MEGWRCCPAVALMVVIVAGWDLGLGIFHRKTATPNHHHLRSSRICGQREIDVIKMVIHAAVVVAYAGGAVADPGIFSKGVTFLNVPVL
ncbi:hypothetical protein Hanom_Chr05g00440441 [Helianthus anomalus]